MLRRISKSSVIATTCTHVIDGQQKILKEKKKKKKRKERQKRKKKEKEKKGLQVKDLLVATERRRN